MLLSDISVKRPVFATVISLLLIAFGIIAFTQLPLREYPDVNAPVINVSTDYPGASAAIVETKVTQLIEDRISGIEGIKHIESVSRDGKSSVTLEFKLSRDIDAAANDVREQVSRLLDNLPEEADPPEISKQDGNNSVVMWLNMSSETMNQMELTDYAERYIQDRLSVQEGVARIRIGGARRFAIRIWLDRTPLAARGLTVQDVENALRTENVELPAGRIESVDREFTARLGRAYHSPEDFARLVIKRGDDGFLIRLSEVARVELGPADTRTELRGNGEPMIGLGTIQQSTANTLAVTHAVKAEAEKVQDTLPAGTQIHQSYDRSIFVEGAIAEVYRTLIIAMALVITVIFLFLGSLRTALVPAVTVPVSLISSAIMLYMFGFSINLLTLLAMVLAIGLVVDDAIVVLENIHRRVELGEPPLLAAWRGSRQVAFAVVATTLVLIAVFVPITFLEGKIGRLFSEFSITMAAAVAFSSIVALSLSPMMCSRLLHKDIRKNLLTRAIESGFSGLEWAYRWMLKGTVRWPAFSLIILLLSSGGIAWLLEQIPKEFAPQEDRGAFFIIAKAPEGASFTYMQRYMQEIEAKMMKLIENNEAKRALVRIPGFGSADAVNSGIGIVVLNPWGERRSAWVIMKEIRQQLKDLPGVRAFPVMRQGLGQSGISQPVQFVIGAGTYGELMEWREIMLSRVAENPQLLGVDIDYEETTPQITIDIDKTRAADLGVSLADIGRTLETMLGARRVTTYPDRGLEYDVILEGEKADKRTPNDLTNIYIRSGYSGQLIPLSNLVTVRNTVGASQLNRYNRVRAMSLSASLAEGYSLGDALAYLEQTVRDALPSTAMMDYKGESLEYKESGSSSLLVFALALLVVFLVLAAQFESFIYPIVIMLTVPLAIIGALSGLWIMNQTLNIYSQIGIVMLIGLATKNGILIVEFANQLRDAGQTYYEALLDASVLRLRPIIMTAITTLAGAIPLIFASGPGAESRIVLGIVVFFGLLSATLFTLFIVPAAYLLVAPFTNSPEARSRQLEKLIQQMPVAKETASPASDRD